MRVGDFRPWTRLLIMCAMLAAVASAARNLSKKLRDARLGEHYQLLLGSDERAARRFRPLAPLAGFPDPGIPQAPLPPRFARALEGFVYDGDGMPVEGAVASAWGIEASSDARGKFTIEGLTPRAPLRLAIVPPPERRDLAAVFVEDVGPGLAGATSAAGRIILPPRAAAAARPIDAPRRPADDRYVFRAGDGGGDASLAGAVWVPDPAPAPAPGERRRILQLKGGTPALADPLGAGGPPPATQSLEVRAESAQGGGESGAVAALDLFTSGVCWVYPGAADSDGILRIARAPLGEHRIIIVAGGCVPAAGDIALPLPGGEDKIHIELEPAAEVEVAVEPAARIAPGCAVRVSAPALRKAIIALPESGRLRLRGLPAETLTFTLMAPGCVPGESLLSAPPLEGGGAEITRTLAPGTANAKVTLHLPQASSENAMILARGEARSGAIVYRAGARLDEPPTYARAGPSGSFMIFAKPGELLYAAEERAGEFLPFASRKADAAQYLRIDQSADICVRLSGPDGAPFANVEVSLVLAGPETLGRATLTKRADAAGIVRFGPLPPHADGMLRIEGATQMYERAVRAAERLESPIITIDLGEHE